jgi:hypothetical protein
LLYQPGDIIGGQTLKSIYQYPGINDAGSVVFDGFYELPNDRQAAAIFSDGEIIAHFGQALDGFTLGDNLFPRIGDNGEILYLASLIETGRGAVGSRNEIVLKVGDDINGMPVDDIASIGTINEMGLAPITTRVGEFPNRRYFVVTEDGVLFRQGDEIAGHSVIGLFGTNTVLNNHGALGLLGAIEMPDATIRQALFAGGQLVVTEGDFVDGKTIARMYPNFDMNDRGDIAFRVEFDDGSRALLLATVSEPSSIALGVAGIAVVIVLRLRTNGRTNRSTSE